jgi:starch-binding outer membrane protein, SusD/RagB family
MKYKIFLQTYGKRCLLIATILQFTFSACDKNALDETPLDFLAPENAYNTLEGIQQGITGLHISVRLGWYGGNPRVIIMSGSAGTDMAFYGEDPGSNTLLSDYLSAMTPEDPEITDFWDDSYEVIQRANVLIKGIIDSDDEIWTSDAQKNAYLAEAMFFRAWAYRFLVALWGDVPLVTEVVNSSKSDFVRAPKADIYKQMEEDLTFATANLPERGMEEAPGRITQGAAWHMLCECYLSQSKFQLAVDAASEIIDGGDYALMTSRFGSTNDVFGSGDVFLDLFAYGNQNLPENTENIWTIQIEPLLTGGLNYPGERAWGPAYFRMGNTPDGFKAFRGEFVNGAYTGYSDTLGRPVAWMRPTNYTAYFIWRSDWYNDIRNAKHNIKREFYFDNPASAYNKQKIDFNLYPPGTRDPLKDTCQYIFPFYMKHADPLNHFTDPARSGGGSNHKDVYAIRLAETILLRAEAYVGLNNYTMAAADLNSIRNRANATPVLPEAVDLDYILDERARELYAEEFRHITLRRMGKLLERVRKYNNNPVNPACNIQDRNVLWPIPQSQIDLNVDAVIEQNPGY